MGASGFRPITINLEEVKFFDNPQLLDLKVCLKKEPDSTLGTLVLENAFIKKLLSNRSYLSSAARKAAAFGPVYVTQRAHEIRRVERFMG